MNHRELLKALEEIRKGLCGYTNDPCDCKYGATEHTVRDRSSEKTGCCELREAIEYIKRLDEDNYLLRTALNEVAVAAKKAENL